MISFARSLDDSEEAARLEVLQVIMIIQLVISFRPEVSVRDVLQSLILDNLSVHDEHHELVIFGCAQGKRVKHVRSVHLDSDTMLVYEIL